jgi:hypothetical protein
VATAGKAPLSETKTRSRGTWYFIAALALLITIAALFGFRRHAIAPGPEDAQRLEGVTASVLSGDNGQSPAMPTAPVSPAPVQAPSVPQTSVAPVSSGPTVIYRSGGFTPNILEVQRGASVQFINDSGSSMRIIANTDTGQAAYPGFDQRKTLGQGGVYDFTFTIPGVWGIKNQYNVLHQGTIVVHQ